MVEVRFGESASQIVADTAASLDAKVSVGWCDAGFDELCLGRAASTGAGDGPKMGCARLA